MRRAEVRALPLIVLLSFFLFRDFVASLLAAALLFAVSIGVFGTSDIIVLKILGFGTALAVLVDSLLVRCLLLRASLGLLSPQIWWLPLPLARLHRRVGLHKKPPPLSGTRFPKSAASEWSRTTGG